MSLHIDNAELMSLLESSDVHTVTQVKDLIIDHLNTGKDAWLVNTVVDAFVESNSSRCLEILGGLSEPHDKHLFDRLYEHWKSGNKLQTLMVLGHLAQREPLWLYKIVSHSLLGCIIKALKTEADIVTLLTGCLTIVALLPVIRTMVAPSLTDIFDLFNRLVTYIHTSSGTLAEVLVLHLHIAANIMFQRLYGMFPCHFLTYLRNTYSRTDVSNMFHNIVKPMLSQVRVHPLLVTANKEKELMRERWKDKRVYDILVECAQLSLDLTENHSEQHIDDPSQLHEVRKPALVKKLSTEFVVSDPVTSSLCGPAPPAATSTFTLSQICGLSTPPPPPSGGATTISPIAQSVASTPASSASSVSQSKPAPLVLPSGGGSWDDSSVPSTPLPESMTPKRQSTSFEFTKQVQPVVTSSDESALDLSGRFGDGGLLAMRHNVYTQTSCDDTADRQELIQRPTERSTSTEDAAIGVESDSSSTPPLPSAIQNTPASVAAFVKKVKRIRFDSISVSKEQSSILARPPPFRSISCPDLIHDNLLSSSTVSCDVIDGSSSSTSSLSRQRHVVIGSPVTPTAMGGIVKLTGDMQVSPMVTETVSVGTQTSVYVYGCEPATVDLLSDRPLVPYELLTAITLPFAPFIQCYSCLHQQTHTMTDIKPFSLSALYTTYSPSDLLDRHIDNCIQLHTANTKQQQLTADQMVDLLTSEVRLLHTQLMLERHKRDINARHCKRLASRLNYLVSLSEHNEAMRDQLRLQEAEFNKMKAAVKDEQLTNQKLKNAFDKQLEEDTAKIRSLSATEESLTAKINQLEMLIKEQKTANDSLARELELAHHEMFLKDKDIELLRQKANGTTQLKDQVTQLNTELLLMGELHEKYQQRLSETSNTHSTQLINMRLGLQAAAAECSELKCELSAKCVELDAYKARLAELEQDIHIKDVLIGEQKQLLEHTKKEYSSRLELAEQKHVSDLKLITSQQQQILDLHSQLVFHQATATTGSGNIGTCSGKDRVV